MCIHVALCVSQANQFCQGARVKELNPLSSSAAQLLCSLDADAGCSVLLDQRIKSHHKQLCLSHHPLQHGLEHVLHTTYRSSWVDSSLYHPYVGRCWLSG